MTNTTTPESALTPAQKRVAELADKLKKAKALAQKQASRIKSKEKAAVKKVDTRKKILVGAYVLQEMEARGEPVERLNINGIIYADWLRRDDDRALFGLAPITVTSQATSQ